MIVSIPDLCTLLTLVAISDESDESQINFIPISVSKCMKRCIYVYLEEKYLLINLVCSLSKIMKMVTL